MASYDRADWHSGGNFPSDLDGAAGGTHIAMFVVWALLAGLGGSIHTDPADDDCVPLRERTLTPGQWFFAKCDGKFWEEDLSGEGNAFARDYYAGEGYLVDYEGVLGKNLPTLYHVSDTWANFDVLAPVIDERLARWREAANSET